MTIKPLISLGALAAPAHGAARHPNSRTRGSAENYLSFSSLARSGLIDQLEFEGFTPSQAQYGVDQAY